MMLHELTTPFSSVRVVVYNASRTKALCKNKPMQLIAGSIYRGKTIQEKYNSYCDVFACYANAPVGIWIGRIEPDYTVDKVMERIKNKGMDSLENYMESVKTRLEKQDHFRFTESGVKPLPSGMGIYGRAGHARTYTLGETM